MRSLASDQGWSTFTDLQRATDGLSAPTLSRLLKVLIEERMVEKDPVHGRYRKGSALLEFAHAALGSLPKARLVQPMLDALADETGQSAALFELNVDAIVMVAKAERAHSCHYIDVGARNSDLARHGFARAVLAHVDTSRAVALIESAVPKPAKPHEKLLAVLEQIRAHGVCVERSESKPNWMRIAAPVHGVHPDGTPDAIGITAVDIPSNVSVETWCGAVRAAARRASEDLGRYYATRIGGDHVPGGGGALPAKLGAPEETRTAVEIVPDGPATHRIGNAADKH